MSRSCFMKISRLPSTFCNQVHRFRCFHLGRAGRREHSRPGRKFIKNAATTAVWGALFLFDDEPGTWQGWVMNNPPRSIAGLVMLCAALLFVASPAAAQPGGGGMQGPQFSGAM